MTQVELAIELGVSQPTISRLENGQPVDRRTELALQALAAQRSKRRGGRR